MTRINVVDPKLFSKGTLQAEYRELPRIFGYVRKAIERGEKPEKYKTTGYKLGTGHCKQFYARLGWLVSRQKAVVAECLARGYQIQHTNPETLGEGIPLEWFGDWTVTEEDVRINLARINERGGLKNGI